MDDCEVAGFFHEIYNGFWLKWRHQKIDTDEQWELLVQDAKEVAKKYPQKLAVVMLTELQMEIESRQKPANNKFNNFESRNYDFDSLERQLLERS